MSSDAYRGRIRLALTSLNFVQRLSSRPGTVIETDISLHRFQRVNLCISIVIAAAAVAADTVFVITYTFLVL